MSILTASVILTLLADTLVNATPAVAKRSLSTSVPIKRALPNRIRRRGTQSGSIGLGDFADNAYSIEVTVGSSTVPVVFDTGSSDLWAITTDCTAATCGDNLAATPKLSTSQLKTTGLSVELDYGDSSHPTSAKGVISTGTVTVAGLSLNDQSVAAVDSTNTGLSDQQLSGIFGIGFPNPVSGSVIFQTILESSASASGSVDTALTDAFINTLPTQGPFASRMVANDQLAAPMFTVTLEREDIEVGGNVGQLTIGSLPSGVSENSLTWVPVRLYSEDEGGLAGSTANPNAQFPSRWEVPLDDVILNGKTLPKPTLPAGVTYTALIDSGTSFLAGPNDVVNAIYSAISPDAASAASSSDNGPPIPCNVPVHLSFVIGGKEFPVDPRDFLGPQQDSSDCTAGSVLPTDPPGPGALMSWILGDPFMKSNLVAFYFGNLTNPATDLPRMGFLSTVPSNADAALASDVAAAATGFIATSVAAPDGTFAPAGTNANGVGQAPTGTSTPQDTGAKGKSSAIHSASLSALAVAFFTLLSVLIL